MMGSPEWMTVVYAVGAYVGIMGPVVLWCRWRERRRDNVIVTRHHRRAR